MKTKRIISIVVIGLITLFTMKKCNNKQEIEVPVVLEIPIPSKENSFEVTKIEEVPYPVKNPINKELLKKYKQAKDSLEKYKLYKEAVTKRKYKEIFEDSVQKITVTAKTTGTLDNLKIQYKTKERIIKVDTVIPVKIKVKKRAIITYIEGGASTDLREGINNTPVVKLGIDYRSKKNNVFGVSYDSQKRVWIKVGKVWKF